MSSPFACVLVRLSIFVGLSVGYKEMTIHVGKSSVQIQADANLLPCFEQSLSHGYIYLTHLGCQYLRRKQTRGYISWLVPEREGPIHSVAAPEKCVDVSDAVKFLQRNQTYTATSRLESLLHRLVTVRKCDGSANQRFLMQHGSRATTLRLASNPSLALTFDIAALTLNHEALSRESEFTLIEYRDPGAASIFAGGAAGARVIWESLVAWQYVLFLGYVALCVKRACHVRVDAVLRCSRKAWAALWTRTDPKAKSLAAERRVRRTQRLLTTTLHLCVVWIVTNPRKHIPFQQDGWDENVFTAMSSEFIPMLFLTTVCLGAYIRPIQDARVLDVLTVLFSCMWAVQYYLLSQGLGGANIEMYLNHESWMMMARTLINLTTGRVIVSIPCSLLVTGVDVYSLIYLTPLHTGSRIVVRDYPYKQILICFMSCTVQWCMEQLVSHEVQTTLGAHKAELYEQLATRLTVSMCDAVVHLDSNLRFSKPATKLAHLLFRHRLGEFPTNFMHLVHAEDRQRFNNHLNFIEPSDIMEPVMPLHLSLLDAFGSRCRVQLFASAYRDYEHEVHYILGFAEIQDYKCAPIEQNEAHGSGTFDMHASGDIPEGNVVESESDASSVSDILRQEERAVDVTICPTSGNVLSAGPSFCAFTKADPVGKYLPCLFHDPPAVWAWLQMKISSLEPDAPSSPQDRSSGVFVLLQGKCRYDVTILVGDLISTNGVISAVELVLQVGKPHKRKHNARSKISKMLLSSSEKAGIACDVTLRLSAASYLDSLDSVQDFAFVMFRPFLRDDWCKWQNWWNECLSVVDGEPFCSSEGNFSVEARKRRSKECLSVCVHLPAVTTHLRTSSASNGLKASKRQRLCL